MENRFENLEVWQEAHQLVLRAYKATDTFPKEEKFGLCSKLRRAAASVATNIVEGNSRSHKKEYLQFLYLARGSLEETKYLLLLSKDLGYLDEDLYQDLQAGCEHVGKMLSGLIKHLKALHPKTSILNPIKPG